MSCEELCRLPEARLLFCHSQGNSVPKNRRRRWSQGYGCLLSHPIKLCSLPISGALYFIILLAQAWQASLWLFMLTPIPPLHLYSVSAVSGAFFRSVSLIVPTWAESRHQYLSTQIIEIGIHLVVFCPNKCISSFCHFIYIDEALFVYINSETQFKTFLAYLAKSQREKQHKLSEYFSFALIF